MYSLNINDDQRYEFCEDKGLEIISGKYNAKGEYVRTAKFIANFRVEVINLVEMRESDSGVITPLVKLILIFANGDESEPVTLPLKTLSKVDWANDVDIRCLLNPDAGKANEHIANIIRLLCNGAETEKATTIDRLGTNVADGVPAYNWGDQITWPENLGNKPNVKWKPMLSTFYYYFIRWYISNFDSICELLKEWATVYRSIKTGIHDRLQETQFCLEAAYKLYLTYRREKGFISKTESLDDYDSFYNQLRALIVEQNDRVNQVTRANPDINYLTIISTIYRTKRFKLVESVKDFEAKEHDGIIHKEHLYLRRDKLIKRIRAVEPTADFDEVLTSLKKQDALKTGSKSNSRQIHGGRNNLRFYVIKLSKLR